MADSTLPRPPLWPDDHPAFAPQVPETSNQEAERRYAEAVARRKRDRPGPTGPSIRPEDFGLGVRSPRPEEWLRGP